MKRLRSLCAWSRSWTGLALGLRLKFIVMTALVSARSERAQANDFGSRTARRGKSRSALGRPLASLVRRALKLVKRRVMLAAMSRRRRFADDFLRGITRQSDKRRVYPTNDPLGIRDDDPVRGRFQRGTLQQKLPLRAV